MKIASNPYKQIEGLCTSFSVAIGGEQQSMYFNTTDPFNNTDFGNYKLYIIKDEVGYPTEVLNQPGLLQDTISGNIYRMYAIFFMPFIPVGFYRYMVYDTTAEQVILITNPFEFILDPDIITKETTRVRYRNSVDIYNYGYEALPAFFNEIRIRIYEPDPVEYPFDAEQYKEVSTGEFQVPKFDIDEQHTFESYWFDTNMHEALAIFLAHSTKFINSVEMTTSQGDGYSVKQSDPRTNLSKFQFKMYRKDFSTINKR